MREGSAEDSKPVSTFQSWSTSRQLAESAYKSPYATFGVRWSTQFDFVGNSRHFLGFLRVLSELSRIILAVGCLVRGRKAWRLTHRGTYEDEKGIQQTAQAPRT